MDACEKGSEGSELATQYSSESNNNTSGQAFAYLNRSVASNIQILRLIPVDKARVSTSRIHFWRVRNATLHRFAFIRSGTYNKNQLQAGA